MAKKAEQIGLKQTHVTMFSSMAHTQDQFVMVNVKAIEPAFPLRGKLEIEPSAQSIQPGQVWLSQRAADLLKVKLGDTVSIADAQFRFSGVIVRDSNQELGFSGFSPTVIIHQADIAKTHAIQTGSRIDYRLLMSGQPNQVQNFSKQFKQQHKTVNDQEETAGLRLRDASESNSRLLRPLENLDTFLQLANILTILLCGIAIALTSQRYVQQNQDHIAVIRCFGASKFQILWAYIGLLCVVSAISIVIGSLLGIMMGYGLLELMLQLIPQLELSFSAVGFLFGPLPIAIFTSVIVLLGFILPSIWELLNTPPIRVIREQAKSRKSLFFMFFAGITSLVIFSLVLSENLMLSIIVLAAIIVLCILLYTVVWGLLRSLKK